jgi:hypothetical protein
VNNHGFDVERFDTASVGEHQAHGEACHLGIVLARRTVQSPQGEVAGDHAGLGSLAFLLAFDLELVRKTGVGAAFCGRWAHGDPPEYHVDVALS